MNPQDGDGNQLSRPTGSIPVSDVGVSSNPLNPSTGFGDVVNAAKEAAAAQTTPQTQFENQFGLPQTPIPPVVDNATGPGLMDTTLSNLKTLPPTAVNALTSQSSTDNLAPEQTPVSTLVTKITNAIEEFREVTEENVAV